VTSEIEASELNALGFSHSRLAVIANGVEIPRELPRSDFDLGELRRPYVLFLGRLNWKKGLDRLIPAMKEVPNADLLVAGNDEENYRSELEALARRNQLIDRVCFWVLLMTARNGCSWRRPKYWRFRRILKTSAMSFSRPWPQAVP
jgi:glycosyltransferase involved in cell wall biosynthesis